MTISYSFSVLIEAHVASIYSHAPSNQEALLPFQLNLGEVEGALCIGGVTTNVIEIPISGRGVIGSDKGNLLDILRSPVRKFQPCWPHDGS